MLLSIEKIISSLITLPGLFLLFNIMILLYLITKTKSFIIKLMSLFIVLLMVITFTALGIHLLVMPLENFAAEIDDFNKAEIKKIPVVVLGGGSHYGESESQDELSSISLARMIKGIMIAQKNEMPLIYSGGAGIGYEGVDIDNIVSAVAKNFENINLILEIKARTTYENGLEIREWLKENQYQKIYLVTSANHMRRSVAVFDNLNIEYFPVVSNYSYSHKLSWLDYLPNRGVLEANLQAVHEWIGLLWYKVNDRI